MAAIPVDTHTDTDDVDVPVNSKAEANERLTTLIHTIEGIQYLTRQLIKNKGAPVSLSNDEILDMNRLRDLEGKLLTIVRQTYTARNHKKGGKRPDVQNVGFKKPEAFRKIINDWLNDPRTTFTPAGFAGAVTSVQLDGTLVQQAVAPNTPLQALITINRPDGLIIDDKNFPLYGVSSPSVLSTLFMLYLDAHGLKGVKIPNGDGTFRPDRRFWFLDQNIIDHFGDIINGEIKTAIEEQNIKDQKKYAGQLAAFKKNTQNGRKKGRAPREPVHLSLSCIPNGMYMKLFSRCKQDTPLADKKVFLSNPTVMALVRADQALVSAATEYQKKLIAV